MDSAGGAEAPKAPPLNPPLSSDHKQPGLLYIDWLIRIIFVDFLQLSQQFCQKPADLDLQSFQKRTNRRESKFIHPLAYKQPGQTDPHLY